MQDIRPLERISTSEGLMINRALCEGDIASLMEELTGYLIRNDLKIPHTAIEMLEASGLLETE